MQKIGFQAGLVRFAASSRESPIGSSSCQTMKKPSPSPATSGLKTTTTRRLSRQRRAIPREATLALAIFSPRGDHAAVVQGSGNQATPGFWRVLSTSGCEEGRGEPWHRQRDCEWRPWCLRTRADVRRRARRTATVPRVRRSGPTSLCGLPSPRLPSQATEVGGSCRVRLPGTGLG